MVIINKGDLICTKDGICGEVATVYEGGVEIHSGYLTGRLGDISAPYDYLDMETRACRPDDSKKESSFLTWYSEDQVWSCARNAINRFGDSNEMVKRCLCYVDNYKSYSKNTANDESTASACLYLMTGYELNASLDELKRGSESLNRELEEMERENDRAMQQMNTDMRRLEGEFREIERGIAELKQARQKKP